MTSPVEADSGIAAGGEHDAHRPALVPLGVVARQAAGDRRALQQVEQVRAQARQHGLRLGVAEAHVELEHARPVGGEHQPGVQAAVEGRAAVAQLVDHRLVDRAHVSPPRARDRCRAPASRSPCRRCSARDRRRRCACSPARAPSARRSRRRTAPAARAPRPRAPPRPPRARRRSAPATRNASSAARASRLVGGDDHALARGQAVELEHDRVALDRPHPVLDGGDRPPRRGGHARGLHDLLGERLGALELRDLARRAEGRDAAGGRAGRPGRRPAAPRGPTTTRSTASRSAAAAMPATSPTRDVEQAGVARDAGVARRAQHLGVLRRAPERADDRVLAPARADDEDLHALQGSR